MTSDGPPSTVLLVDDQPIVAKAIADMLEGESDLSLCYCMDARRAATMAAEVLPNVILQDLVMPGYDGFTLLAELRRDPATRDVPIIVLSSKEDPRDKSRAFQSGASDYLVKLPDKIELIARLHAHAQRYVLQKQRDEAYRALEELKQQLEEKNAILERLSQLDGLTGIANRRRFDEALEVEWKRAARDGSWLSLILIDVDFFKPYNDRYGHQKGDECLRAVAHALSDAGRRPADVVARYGGEEFVMLLPSTDEEGARAVAEAARERIAELGIAHEGSLVATHVTASVGVASVQPDHATTGAPSLLQRADAALYRSKQAGRNRVTVAPT